MEHYSEDGNSFEDEIADLMDLRQVYNNMPCIHNISATKSNMKPFTKIIKIYFVTTIMCSVFMQKVSVLFPDLLRHWSLGFLRETFVLYIDCINMPICGLPF